MAETTSSRTPRHGVALNAPAAVPASYHSRVDVIAAAPLDLTRSPNRVGPAAVPTANYVSVTLKSKVFRHPLFDDLPTARVPVTITYMDETTVVTLPAAATRWAHELAPSKAQHPAKHPAYHTTANAIAPPLDTTPTPLLSTQSTVLPLARVPQTQTFSPALLGASRPVPITQADTPSPSFLALEQKVKKPLAIVKQ